MSRRIEFLWGTLGLTPRLLNGVTHTQRNLGPLCDGPLEVGTMKQVVSFRGPSIDGPHELFRAEARHRELDQRLKDLGRRAYLTPTEQFEVAELKKQRLLLKDEVSTLRKVL
jgi:uncharacterized protein YdcH (DUF465 family)